MTTIEQIRALAAAGIGLRGVEASLRRSLNKDELDEYYRARTIRQIKIAQKKAAGAKSSAERVRDFVARANELGAFDPSPRHPRLKERCKYDLEAFGWFYCRQVLRHRASAAIKDGLIKDVQDAILYGGKFVKEYGRGAGKTTWICHIAIVWAILYGHRRYPVIISATGKLAKKNLKTIKRILSRSKAIRQDFLEIVKPLDKLGDIAQRANSITYQGQSVDVEWSSEQIKLAMLRDSGGAPLGPGCGAIVGSVGIGGAIRGANEEGQRPDFLIIDDPQTKKIAHSPSLVQGVIDYIHQDALMLAGHDRVMSAFVAITPQVLGDVATELTSQSKHPEWSVTIEPFVKTTCPDWDDLVAEFIEEYNEDAANHDVRFSRSTAWYRENVERFTGVELLDPYQYDHHAEIDGVHHILNLRASLGEAAFNAEVMMSVSDADSELYVSADRVANCVNGYPRGILPPGTDSAVAFCDVNIRKGKGISWAVVAFGPGRVGAVVAYGRYPERGALVPPNTSDDMRAKLVAGGIREVINRVMNIRLRDVNNRKINLEAMGFDRGYLPDVVHRTLTVLRRTQPIPFRIVAVRGFGWKQFGVREKDKLRRGDHIFATRSPYGQYLAEMAPYWREKMQSGFLETPLMPGSLSIFGKNPVEHFEFANEVAAEKLVRKYVVDSRGRSDTAWDWAVTGENHYCDVLTGAFALASYYRCYDNLSQVLDKSILRHVTHQDDLFDRRVNPEIDKAQPKFDDEGTGVEIAPEEKWRDKTSSPFLPRKVVKKNYKLFRRGKWTK